RFKGPRDRVANQQELDALVAAFFTKRTLEDNLAYCAEQGITVGAIADAAELIDHEYIKGRGVLVHAEDQDFGTIPMHNVFPRLSETPGAIRTPAPDVGQHTAEILDFIGCADDERAALKERGVI
ncbi:MAG: CoA transferase, partial [Pseudomonadota bacterium]